MNTPNPLHWHRCAACEEELVCKCADQQQRILCFDCAEMEKMLKAFFEGEEIVLERVN